MTNEPGPGMGLDPEVLAAYVDGSLTGEERAAVEARLAADPDAYAWLVEVMQAQDELAAEAAAPRPVEARGIVVPFSARGAGEATAVDRTSEAVATVVSTAGSHAVASGGGVREAAIQNVPAVRSEAGSKRRPNTWLVAAGALALAAALVLAVRLQPDLLSRLRVTDGVDPRMAKLVAAVGEERYIEARLTGGFKYGPLRTVTRGANDLSSQNLALLAAAGELQKKAQEAPAPENLHAWGVAQVLLGQYDGAIETLEQALLGRPQDAGLLNDLAAALIARSTLPGGEAGVNEAVEVSERALRARPDSFDALFNRALAADLARQPQAKDFWRRAAEHAPNDALRADAARRLVRTPE